MAIIVIGVNHHTASAALREKITFPESQLPHALEVLLSSTDNLTEAVILSTCNRTELYAVAKSANQGIEELTEFVRDYKQLSPKDMEAFQAAMYARQSRAAIGRLFRVICSLDSLVLGEAQIQGQIKRAYQAAKECGATKELFNKLFKQALELGKNARSKTGIGAQSVSVSTVAVQLAQRIFGNLDGKTVLVIGAGEMAELTLSYLRCNGTSRLFVANRTREYARDLIGRVGGEGFFGLDELGYALSQADIVIASAYYPEGFLVTKKLVQKACENRIDRPLLLVDIALPRNIDDTCSNVDGVYCYSLDDLGAIIDQNKQQRELEAEKVRAMIHDEVDAFLLWMQERAVVPTIKELYGKAERICQREVAKAVKELRKTSGVVTEEDERVLMALATAVAKKQLHGPVVRLRKQAKDPDAYIHTESARYLFGLDTNPLGLPCGNRSDHCALEKGSGCSVAEIGECPFGNKIDEEDGNE